MGQLDAFVREACSLEARRDGRTLFFVGGHQLFDQPLRVFVCERPFFLANRKDDHAPPLSFAAGVSRGFKACWNSRGRGSCRTHTRYRRSLSWLASYRGGLIGRPQAGKLKGASRLVTV